MPGNHTLPSLVTCTEEGFMWCFGSWAGSVTLGVFWILMMLGFCIAIFMATYRLGFPRSFGYASFVGMVGGIWLLMLGFIQWEIASVFILTGVAGIVVMFMRRF